MANQERQPLTIWRDGRGNPYCMFLNPKMFTDKAFQEIVRYRLLGCRENPMGVTIAHKKSSRYIPAAEFRRIASQDPETQDRFVEETTKEMAYADQVLLINEAFFDTP